MCFSALTRLGGRKGIWPAKNWGWWRWPLVSPDGVAPSQMVGVNLPLHQKVQKFSSGTGSPGWSRKKGRKTVLVLPALCTSLWNLLSDNHKMTELVSIFRSGLNTDLWSHQIYKAATRIVIAVKCLWFACGLWWFINLFCFFDWLVVFVAGLIWYF